MGLMRLIEQGTDLGVIAQHGAVKMRGQRLAPVSSRGTVALTMAVCSAVSIGNPLGRGSGCSPIGSKRWGWRDDVRHRFGLAWAVTLPTPNHASGLLHIGENHIMQ
jgi:hypothetical protein